LLCVAGVSPASSQQFHEKLPLYDIERTCEWQQSDRKLIDAAEYRECFARQQQAYDKLKESWGSLSRGIRTFCPQFAHINGSPGSYFWLEACVSTELKKEAEEAQRKASRPDLKFRH